MQAPAKVNLCLSVKFPPVDGYHAIDSVFQTLDLHDTVEFESCDASGAPDAVTKLGTPVALACGDLRISVRDNLVFKAVERAELACRAPFVAPGQLLRISVDKRIPAGGGLGGGSSDAAAVLKAYAAAQGIEPLDGRLLEAARGLGADVAFFLYGGAALMCGRGDVLQRRLPSFPLPLVLMGDAQGNSTAQVYAAFDGRPAPAPDAFALADALEAGEEPARLAELCANNLQDAACEVGSALAERIERAQADPSVLGALVTGSGATSFAICATRQDAERFAARARAYCDWVRIACACES